MMDYCYLNTEPANYQEICNDNNYVDKTGLIHCINRRIGSREKLFLVSRPRRFGKTYAAEMLKAYYTVGYDTEKLFRDKIIHQMDPELTYRGAFDVIYIDILDFKARAFGEQEALKNRAAVGKKPEKLNWIRFMKDSLIRELADRYGTEIVRNTLPDTMFAVTKRTGRKFIWICDEWDNFFREPADDENAPEQYIELLRSLFKTPHTSSIFAAAYMTGILPMIRMKGESALTEFFNYTMFVPKDLAPYFGFTEAEVRDLLRRNPDCRLTYEELAQWYEGYAFPKSGPLFNPRSVIEAILSDYCSCYWVDSGSNKQLSELVSLKKDTLRRDVELLLAGEEFPVEQDDFDNDLHTLMVESQEGNGAVLAAMVHLGYLCFDQATRSARIPNSEIRSKLLRMIKESPYQTLYKKLADSDQILEDTLKGNKRRLEEAFRRIHLEHTAPMAYNSEATLKETVDLAYYTACRFYIFGYEIPSGEGYVDVVLYPKQGCAYPLLLIELKKNDSAKGAIHQIHERKYPAGFQEYGGREIILVGISYDANKLEKEHHCEIEKIRLPVF